MNPQTGTAFEDRLTVLMREQADLRIDPQRPVPPFDPRESEPEPSSLRRFLPLIAAVVVLVLGLGAFLLVANSRRTTIPAEPVPDGRQQVLGARIAVPDGWVIRPATEFEESYYFISVETTFCVMPKADAGTKDWTKCPVWIGSYDDSLLDALSVPDAVYVLFQDIDICPELNALPKPKLAYDQRDFGGRQAEWRSWTYRCSATRSDYFENYSVQTGPDFVMSTMQDSDVAREALSYIARRSQLPAQTTKLRYHDQGVVTKVNTAADVTTITMDRFYGFFSSGTAVRSRTSISYELKAAVFTEATSSRRMRVGDPIRIDTNGTDVTWVQNYNQ